jgi:membrane-associated phospholipid phosphatase
MSSARLAITSLISLLAFAALALVVAHGSGPYGFEKGAIDWLGQLSAVRTWSNVAELLGTPAVVAVLVVCFALGLAKQAFLRIALYAGLAVGAILISEHIAKPLVQRTYFSELTFPSGSVTAASATAVAMWLALFPLLERRARIASLILGLAWILLMSSAVVGGLWHTPLDVVGSLLLSVGIISAGGAILELPMIREATLVRREREIPMGTRRRRDGPGVDELLGEAENPVGVAQAQSINQKEG